MTRIIAFLLSAAATPLAAACPTTADLAGGIVFGLDGGGRALARSTGTEITVEYQNLARTQGEIIEGAYGLYPSKITYWYSGGEDVIGVGGDQVQIIRRSGRDVVPADGAGARLRLRTVVTDNDVITGVTTSRFTAEASYAFGEPRSVTVSGCDFDILAVETTYSGDPRHSGRRWAYFTDLGVAIATRDIRADGTVIEAGITSVAVR